MAYFGQKYRIPTPPKNPKVLEYKQDAKIERFRLLLNELQDAPTAQAAAEREEKLLILYERAHEPADAPPKASRNLGQVVTVSSDLLQRSRSPTKFIDSRPVGFGTSNKREQRQRLDASKGTQTTVEAAVVKVPKVTLAEKEAQVEPALLAMSDAVPAAPGEAEHQVDITIRRKRRKTRSLVQAPLLKASGKMTKLSSH